MNAGEKPLHDSLRHDLDPAEPRYFRGIEEIKASGVDHGWRKLIIGGLSGVEDTRERGDTPHDIAQSVLRQLVEPISGRSPGGMPPAPLPAPEGTMLAQLAALSLLPSSGHPVGWPDASSRTRIEVWTNRGDDAYASGPGAREFLRGGGVACVSVLRVEPARSVTVMFPL